MTFAWLILSLLAIAAAIGAAYRVQAKQSLSPIQEISSTPPQFAEEPDPEEPLQPSSELPPAATPTVPTAPAPEEEPIPVPPIAEPAAVEILLEEMEHHPAQQPV